jgi:hypothetical protein
MLRKDMIDLVLATDMKQHFMLNGMFTEKVVSAAKEHSALAMAKRVSLETEFPPVLLSAPAVPPTCTGAAPSGAHTEKLPMLNLQRMSMMSSSQVWRVG